MKAENEKARNQKLEMTNQNFQLHPQTGQSTVHVYSYRNAIIGSTLVALLAGK